MCCLYTTLSVRMLLLLLLLQESDILFFFTQVHKLQPGFYIAVDNEEQKLLWVIRGKTQT